MRLLPRKNELRLSGTIFLLATTTVPSTTVARAGPCSGDDAASWVKNIHERATSFDELANFAVERYGQPVTCEGTVTTTFDGNEFGRLLLTFKGGATFEIETFPPESSVAILSDSSGFEDESMLRERLEVYTREIGLAIDWTQATVTGDDRTRTELYRDPDDGMNAFASIVFSNGTPISIRVSLAL